MKAYVVSFVLMLVLSCLLFSLIPEQPPPYPMPVGVGHVRESGFGMERAEGNIPEIHLTDTARSVGFMTKIDEKSNERTAEFPLGANN
ncbi:MAG: hypothetical protein K2X29_07255 [Candidatus Obscuribacterales bacterium]|nr:hypothetical protein [Candidatus Obscuribacterales bacterium]